MPQKWSIFGSKMAKIPIFWQKKSKNRKFLKSVKVIFELLEAFLGDFLDFFAYYRYIIGKFFQIFQILVKISKFFNFSILLKIFFFSKFLYFSSKSLMSEAMLDASVDKMRNIFLYFINRSCGSEGAAKRMFITPPDPYWKREFEL